MNRMTKEEALEKITELVEYIKGFDAIVGDEIFLLSTEEYVKYKERIPVFRCWWWLRTPSNENKNVACVNFINDIAYTGGYIGRSFYIRPAIKLKNNDLPIGSRTIKYNFPWIIIDKDLAIAEVPIAEREFDSELNDYETSEVRQFLLEWLENRR